MTGYRLFPPERGAGKAPIFLLPGGEERGETVLAKARELTTEPFALAYLPVEDWDRDLSPWPAPAVFKGGSDFGGGGNAALARLSGELLPSIREELAAPEAPVYLAGYSLAGLLAVYGLYRLPELTGCVCCSGSLWFPGFLDYARGHAPVGAPQRVYLSLGDREKKSRNPVLSQVETCTLALRDLLTSGGISCLYVSEPGNHFQDPEGRLARGIAWCVNGGG